MTDIALASSGDLSISTTGDFLPAESTQQHQQQLLLNNKGDFKQNPTTGIGVWNYIDDDGNNAAAPFASLTRAIALEFVKDGMDVVSLSVSSSGNINCDAYYV